MTSEEHKQGRYEARWVGYHVILCIGLYGTFACTLYALFFGWG